MSIIETSENWTEGHKRLEQMIDIPKLRDELTQAGIRAQQLGTRHHTVLVLLDENGAPRQPGPFISVIDSRQMQGKVPQNIVDAALSNVHAGCPVLAYYTMRNGTTVFELLNITFESFAGQA